MKFDDEELDDSKPQEEMFIVNSSAFDDIETPVSTDVEIVNREIDIIRNKNLGLKNNRIFFEKLLKKHIRGDRDYILCASSFEGEGKTLSKGSKILMTNGEFKNVEDIKVGDLVLSPQHDGTNISSKVTETHSWFCDNTYDITELNRKHKVLYSCSNNHLIPINTTYPKINNKKNWNNINIEAQAYSKKSFYYKQNSVSFLSFPIEKFYFRKNCDIEPYTLGVWLGDGHFTKELGVTSNDIEIINEISKFYDVTRIGNKSGTTCKTYNYGTTGILAKLLEKYNLRYKKSGYKFIPKEALLSDITYRKKLLAGLIDTDGTLSKTQSYSITTKSEQLSKDIKFLVHTLGGRCNIRKIKKGIKSTGFIGEYYHVGLYLGNIDIPIQLKRKIRIKQFFYKSANRISIDAIPSKPSMVYGFTLDSPSGWHIVNDEFMITHNSRMVNQLGTEICRCKTKEQKLYFLKANTVYDPTGGEFIRMLKAIKPKSILLVDEAQKLLYKRNYNSTERKSLNILFSTIREKNLIVIFCIPDFYDLDVYFRNWRVKSWIYIPIRGLAIVFKKSNSPFSKDKWEQKRNQQIIEHIEDTKNDGRLLSKTGIIVALRKLKSYGFEFGFSDWDEPDVKAQYLQYKDWGSTTKPEEKTEEETSEIERNRKIAQTLFLKGCKIDEIVSIIGKNKRTIYDYVQPVRDQLHKETVVKDKPNGIEISKNGLL